MMMWMQDKREKRWKLDRLQELFLPEDMSIILGSAQVGLSLEMNTTGLIPSMVTIRWDLDIGLCEIFLVELVTTLFRDSVSTLLPQAWKLKTTRKLKHFVWQCISGCLATCQPLSFRHIGIEKRCPRCGAEENHQSSPFECPPSHQAWTLSHIPLGDMFPASSMYINCDYLFWKTNECGAGEDQLRLFPWFMWFNWKNQNRKLLDNINNYPQDMLSHAVQEKESWRNANIIEREEVPGRVTIPRCPRF